MCTWEISLSLQFFSLFWGKLSVRQDCIAPVGRRRNRFSWRFSPSAQIMISRLQVSNEIHNSSFASSQLRRSSCNEAPRLFRFALTFNGHHHQLMAIKQQKTKKTMLWRTTTASPARDNLLKKKRTEKRRLLSLAQGKTRHHQKARWRNGPRDEIKRRVRWEENGWLCWWKKRIKNVPMRVSGAWGEDNIEEVSARIHRWEFFFKPENEVLLQRDFVFIAAPTLVVEIVGLTHLAFNHDRPLTTNIEIFIADRGSHKKLNFFFTFWVNCAMSRSIKPLTALLYHYSILHANPLQLDVSQALSRPLHNDTNIRRFNFPATTIYTALVN